MELTGSYANAKWPADLQAGQCKAARRPATRTPDGIWPTDNSLDVPALLPELCADVLEAPLVGWGSLARGSTRMPGTWHFYTDDYRFRHLLDRPAQLVDTAAVAAVEPNLSLSDDMPYPQALIRVYNKRWVARFWQSKGLKIWVDLNVPARWAKLNLLGVPQGWAAYATRGYNHRTEATLWEYQLAEERAGGRPIFLVFGGGEDVGELCRANSWIWIPERRLYRNGKV